MAFQVDIISKEIIKPSSTTPNHLNIYKLSLLEQAVSVNPVPVVLFYASTNDKMVENKNILVHDHLMRSLSNTLTQYYPLAGRIDNNEFITCNDEGIDFFKARVNGQLHQFLINPKYEKLEQLLPITDKFYGLGSRVLLSVQANIFDCGGIAIGVCVLHSLDASSVCVFLNSWAAHANRNIEITQPIFDMTPFFPPKESTPIYARMPESQTKKTITKRFVFDECNIVALKDKCSSNSYIENPSRVESIIALLWLCAMESAISVRKKDDDIKPPMKSSVACISVDLRKRMIPPLSNLHVGNIVFSVFAKSTIESCPELLHSLVGEVRKEIMKFDSNYLRKIQLGEGYFELLDSIKVAQELHLEKKQVCYTFTSWCRFPFYEIDFGWGKPNWVSPVINWENVMILYDTKCGKGVEAWVSLVEEDMDIFEHQLISFISNLKM